MSELADLLGAPPPAGVAALDDAAQRRLVAVIIAARHQQAQDLAASFAATIAHVPFPLRAVVRAVLSG